MGLHSVTKRSKELKNIALAYQSLLLILSLLVGDSIIAVGEQGGDESAEGNIREDFGDDGGEVEIGGGVGVDERSEDGDDDGDGDFEGDNETSSEVSCNFLLQIPLSCLPTLSSPNM